MEILTLPAVKPHIHMDVKESSSEGFIQANTQSLPLVHLKTDCIIPVFAKDNESTISHYQFIEAVAETVHQIYAGERILMPSIRVSHPIKGRIPEAMGKPAHLLSEDEKTIYFERMAFMMEIPSIRVEVAGNELSLMVGGVRAYNHENLYGKKTEERFKVFVGFKNRVCTNLCISTDGFRGEIKARTVKELANQVLMLLLDYNDKEHLERLNQLQHHQLSEHQFAQVVGRLRMFQFLPNEAKRSFPELQLGDSQINAVVKEFYQDENFCQQNHGEINLWRVYNLLTGANKSSYIDTFSDRLVNIDGFVHQMQDALSYNRSFWYLS